MEIKRTAGPAPACITNCGHLSQPQCFQIEASTASPVWASPWGLEDHTGNAYDHTHSAPRAVSKISSSQPCVRTCNINHIHSPSEGALECGVLKLRMCSPPLHRAQWPTRHALECCAGHGWGVTPLLCASVSLSSVLVHSHTAIRKYPRLGN